MPDPVITDPPVPRARRSAYVTCDFCQCELTEEGDVIRRGQRAREMMTMADEHEEQAETITRLTARVAELETAAAARQEPPAPAAKKGWLDPD